MSNLNCVLCSGCSGCLNCGGCNYCGNCVECTDCNNSLRCEDCVGCRACTDCKNLINCEKCDGWFDMMDYNSEILIKYIENNKQVIEEEIPKVNWFNEFNELRYLPDELKQLGLHFPDTVPLMPKEFVKKMGNPGHKSAQD